MKRIAAIVLALILALSMIASASAVTYRQGSKGSGVVRIQKYLTEKGYGTLKADGKYGKETVEVVKDFQRIKGLKVDGICGPSTLKAMGLWDDNDNNPNPSEDDSGNDNSVMQLGSTGPAVKQLQLDLKALGYPVGKADGKFGASTKNAVMIFQRLNNLKADGKAGEKTLNMLNSGNAAAYNTSVRETKYTTLKLGSKDTTANKKAVSRLQKALINLGFLASDHVTGYYDAVTKQAVMAFQADRSIKEDGIAGNETQALLYGN